MSKTTSTALTPIAAILGECRHSDAILHRNPNNNAIGFYCGDCRSWVKKFDDKLWLPKDHVALEGVDLAALPLAGERHYRKCEGPCGRIVLCEFHHLAPRKFFTDADAWPTAYLCADCHDRWHATVTPGLCTTYNPTAHASQLIDYLGLDRAASLTRALMDIGRAKRAGAA